MFAPLDIRAIAAFVFNIQITIQLQPYPIVFQTAYLRPITPGGSFSDIANLALLKIQKAAFGDMGREQVERVDMGHGLLPRSCWNMRSLLVRATFGEGVGILVLGSGKRSSENGFQTTFLWSVHLKTSARLEEIKFCLFRCMNFNKISNYFW